MATMPISQVPSVPRGALGYQLLASDGTLIVPPIGVPSWYSCSHWLATPLPGSLMSQRHIGYCPLLGFVVTTLTLLT